MTSLHGLYDFNDFIYKHKALWPNRKPFMQQSPRHIKKTPGNTLTSILKVRHPGSPVSWHWQTDRWWMPPWHRPTSQTSHWVTPAARKTVMSDLMHLSVRAGDVISRPADYSLRLSVNPTRQHTEQSHDILFYMHGTGKRQVFFSKRLCALHLKQHHPTLLLLASWRMDPITQTNMTKDTISIGRMLHESRPFCCSCLE